MVCVLEKNVYSAAVGWSVHIMPTMKIKNYKKSIKLKKKNHTSEQPMSKRKIQKKKLENMLVQTQNTAYQKFMKCRKSSTKMDVSVNKHLC